MIDWEASSDTFLEFSTGNGGHVVRVHGDLATATNVAIVVPGFTTSLWNFDASTDKNAKQLFEQMGGPHRSVATIAWLGYDAPKASLFADGWAVSQTDRAERGAKSLTSLVHSGIFQDGAAVTLVGHSYGSLLVGMAATAGLQNTIVLLGSPGIESGMIVGRGPMYVGHAPGDMVAGLLANTHVFGGSPENLGSGIRLPVNGPSCEGMSGHSSYFRTRSLSLTNIADVADGNLLEESC